MKFVSDSRRLVPVFGLALLLALPLGVAAASGGAHGSLDRSFRSGGRVFLPSGFSASALVLQPDGKLVTAGDGKTGFALLRYNPVGSLDTSFGHFGRVTTAVGAPGGSFSVLVRQPDGKLVAAGIGFITKSTSTLVILRYNPDGSLDPSFGKGGRVTTVIGPDYVSALVRQPDGKLVVAGTRSIAHSHSVNKSVFALIRYNANGSLDRTFGSGGMVTTAIGARTDPDTPDSLSALVLQPDGKLVAAGTGNVDHQEVFALVRYKQNGSLDPSFGTGGEVTTSTPAGRGASALVRQPDQKLVAAGTGTPAEVVRYKPNGSLDPSFGNGGEVMTANTVGAGTDLSSFFRVLLRQPDGKLVGGGEFEPGGFALQDIALVRYKPGGSLDRSFGKGGIVTTMLDGDLNNADAMVRQPDGKLVLAASYTSNSGCDSDPCYSALLRYNPNGSLDQHFGRHR